MTSKFYRISLKETFVNCQDIFIDDIPSSFSATWGNFDISEFTPFIF